METQANQDIGVDRGIFVRGTPLWIDARRKKSHVILTSLQDRLPVKHERLLTSIPMAAMLDRAGLQATVLPGNFRNWMGFGGRQVQLVELGVSQAESGVLIDDGSRRTLVLPSMVPGIDALPPVDHLVLGARALGHQGMPLTEFLASLVRSQEIQSRRIVRVETLEVGLVVLDALEQLGQPARAVGLLGRLSNKGSGPRNAWVVAFPREKVRASGEPVLLNTGCGAWSGGEGISVSHYGGFQEVERVLQMTTATSVTLVDLPRGQSIPESFASDRNFTVHHPVEKSMSLDFEAFGRL